MYHPPLHTVREAKALRPQLESDEGQIKNLFVRNKKGKMWLLTLHESQKIDLKATAIALGAGRFSFCSPQRLMKYLGVTPGAVSPFGLLNDIHHEVAFYFEKTLMRHSVIHAHPMDNRITVSIATGDLLAFLDQHGHPHHVFDVAGV